MADERPRWTRVDDGTPLVAFIRLCNERLERALDLVSRLIEGRRAGGLRFLGQTTSTSTPSTTQLPNSADCAVHVNTSTSKVYLAYNLGGVIKKVELT